MTNTSICIENGKSNMANKKYHTEEERVEAIRASKRKYQTRYREINPEYKRNWKKENIEKVKEYNRKYESNKRRIDPIYKFSVDIRNLINDSFKRKNCIKPKKTEEILGCSMSEFKEYILSKCTEGVKLEDFGLYGYHIDHVIPLASATSLDDIIRLCHYTNLQPLWCKENLKKSNKLI